MAKKTLEEETLIQEKANQLHKLIAEKNIEEKSLEEEITTIISLMRKDRSNFSDQIEKCLIRVSKTLNSKNAQIAKLQAEVLRVDQIKMMYNNQSPSNISGHKQ